MSSLGMTGNGNYTAEDRLRAMLAAELRLGLSVAGVEVPVDADMSTLWRLTDHVILDGRRPFNLEKSFAYADVLDMMTENTES